MTTPRPIAAALAALLTFAAPLSGQSVLERAPNLPSGWIGLPWMAEFDILDRIDFDDSTVFDATALPTFTGALGLPGRALVGGHFAVQSPVAGFDETNEWAIFGRFAPFDEALGAPLDAAVQVGLNGAAESVDGELALARWFGPVRLLAAARAFSDGYDSDDARAALLGGAVWHPFPGELPIALAGDIGSLLDRDAGEDWVWGVGVQIGVPFTPNTLSLHATNAASGTLQGQSRGGDTRFGFEITIPIPVGEVVGAFASREVAARAVVRSPPASDRVVRIPIERYAFRPARIEIPAGTTVEWINRDEVVHTATSDNGTWNSGAIPPGERWRARFTEPGIYPYHCGPHPYMRAVVIVR